MLQPGSGLAQTTTQSCLISTLVKVVFGFYSLCFCVAENCIMHLCFKPDSRLAYTCSESQVIFVDYWFCAQGPNLMDSIACGSTKLFNLFIRRHKVAFSIKWHGFTQSDIFPLKMTASYSSTPGPIWCWTVNICSQSVTIFRDHIYTMCISITNQSTFWTCAWSWFNIVLLSGGIHLHHYMVNHTVGTIEWQS